MKRPLMFTLIRRELWEHRGLWIAPLVVAALLVIATFLGGNQGGPVRIAVDGNEAKFLSAIQSGAQSQFLGVLVAALLVPQLVVALVVTFFYLLDSLYSERKDRSILFWKSMPVSDERTVLSKALVGLLVVPLWVWVLSLVTSVLAIVALHAKLSATPFAALASFEAGAWLAVQGTLLVNVLIAALWYAPIAAALLFVSAFARRAVFLWAVVPPLLAMFLEEIAFDTNRVASFLAYRFGGFFESMGFGLNRPRAVGVDAQVAVVRGLYADLNAASLLQNVDLWLGVAVAGALLFGAARLRRYRDDT